MEKIPTLFVRDGEDRRFVTREVSPGCDWVLAGEGSSTRKFDGTCVMFDGWRWWARREVKPGKAAPPNFVALSTDQTTGKTMGWEPVEQSAFAKWHDEVLDRYRGTDWEAGTYELCGPKINGNPENFVNHALLRHGVLNQGPSLRSYDSIRDYLAACVPPIEGFVYHHPDGRMAKIKTKDFPAEVAA